jgi:hypothetical protein
MKIARLASLVLALLLVPGLLAAQDLGGMWDITASFTLSQGNPAGAPAADCEYSGTGISLVQNGGEVSGTVDLNLDSGIETCPGQMTGELAASVMGSQFDGMIDGGKDLGTAKVNGSISGTGKVQSGAQAGNTIVGTVTRISAFPAATGTLTGQQLPITPTLGPVAVGIMALILFGGSLFLLTRRDRLST